MPDFDSTALDPQLDRESIVKISDEDLGTIASVMRLDISSVDRYSSAEYVQPLAYDMDVLRDEAFRRNLIPMDLRANFYV